MTLEEILKERSTNEVVQWLKDKAIEVPSWAKLRKEFYPEFHEVNDKGLYPDIVKEGQPIEKVTRVTYNWQKLAANRMAQFCFSTPVKRTYKPQNDNEEKVKNIIEAIILKNRMDAENIERARRFFSECEIMTLWYAIEEPNNYYKVNSKLKIRNKTFSPQQGHSLYPMFDANGDYIAMTVAYRVYEDGMFIDYIDTYTKDRHLKFKMEGDWKIIEDEQITIGKNPTIYMFREEPIWEDRSSLVTEREWTVSRNGNYLRKNSKPVWVVCGDDPIEYGNEESQDQAFTSILQYPANSKAGYETWEGAIDNLKFQTKELKDEFFSSLQLPDLSFENMKTVPMSAESRKQMYRDAQLKVATESKDLLIFLDREINVIREFVKVIAPELKNEADSLEIHTQIIPFAITDENEEITNVMTATGGKAIMSQREGVEKLGYSKNIDKTLEEIQSDEDLNLFEPTV